MREPPRYGTIASSVSGDLDQGDETLIGDSETLPGRPTTRPGRRRDRLARGETIGRYVVLNELGAGGMGVVYAAYDPELDRKLAIKLLHAEASGKTLSTGGTARLLREAQALARLSHPNTVTVHDVGTHDDAVFLAMEHVEGGTMSDWVERGPHPLPEVLRVFVPAGRGLAAAHAAGLVHRDFKPENVLLGEDGAVRVADFGLARPDRPTSNIETPSRDVPVPADPSASGSALAAKLTVTGAIMGTPAYMAPEQHLGNPIDGRADQFAFCVALFETLYGVRPFGGESVAALAFQVTHGEIRDPPRDIVVPSWVRRIVLRGLSRDPADRYPSMDALLSDLDRDLAGRRRMWLAAGGGAALVLAVGIGVAGVGDDSTEPRCVGFEEQLADVWGPDGREKLNTAFANSELAYARSTADRVADRLDELGAQWVSQARASCEATHVQGSQSADLLDLRTACLNHWRRDTRALVDVLSRPADEKTVKKAVDALETLPPLSRCENTEALGATQPLPRDPATREAIEAVQEQIARATALHAAGKYDEGLKVAQEAAAAAEPIDYGPLEASAQFRLVVSGTATDDAALTAKAVERTIRVALASHEDDLAARAAYHMLWVVSPEGADPADLDHWANLAEGLVERTGDDLLRIDLASNLTNALRRRGELDRARETIDRALEQAVAAFGDDSRPAAMVRMNLAAVAWAQGDFATSARVSRAAHETWSRIVGPEHPRALHALNNLGISSFTEGDYPGAEKTMRRLVELRTRLHGEGSKATADARSNLAMVLAKSGKTAEGLRLQEQLIEDYTRLDGPDSTSVGESWANLAVALGNADRPKEALDAARKAQAILEAKLGLEHPQLVIAWGIVGAFEREAGNLNEAEKVLRQALAVGEKTLGADSSRLATPLLNLADVALDRGDGDTARASAERARKVSEGQPAEPADQADQLRIEARIAREIDGDEKTAMARAQQALSLAKKTPGAVALHRRLEAFLAGK